MRIILSQHQFMEVNHRENLQILGELVILYNSQTGFYAGQPGVIWDTVFVRIRAEIGEILTTLPIGSGNDTMGYDIKANHQGI